MAPKPDPHRLTPIRSNYLNNNNLSSSTTSSFTTAPPSPVVTTTSYTTPSSSSSSSAEHRRVILPDRPTTTPFKPISENNSTAVYANVAPIPTSRSVIGSNILALQEKMQMRASTASSSPSSASPATTTANYANPFSTTATSTSSPPTISTPTTTTIQTNKQITIQDIDTNKYEEIPAKEPDLNRQPEKSALKKANGLKRRVIPVFRENQRPSPRPSPKMKPVVQITPPTAGATSRFGDDRPSDSEQNGYDHSSSEDDENDGQNGNPDHRKRFANVQRNDSLARFLKDRPLPNELFEKHILVKPVDERKNERETIETKLERKLSLRPSLEELEARNILRAKTPDEIIAEKEEKKRYLIRKLSFRPSIQGRTLHPSIGTGGLASEMSDKQGISLYIDREC